MATPTTPAAWAMFQRAAMKMLKNNQVITEHLKHGRLRDMCRAGKTKPADTFKWAGPQADRATDKSDEDARNEVEVTSYSIRRIWLP